MSRDIGKKKERLARFKMEWNQLEAFSSGMATAITVLASDMYRLIARFTCSRVIELKTESLRLTES